MRITGGKYKGRVFTPPKAEGLRPTMERVRQAVFSMLESLNLVEGSSALDLYSGSGAFGVEALSRGAASCVFIEKNRALVEFTRSTLSKLQVPAQSGRVIQGTLPDIMKTVDEEFDLIFCDPPYKEISDMALQAEILHRAAGMLRQRGALVLESGARDGIEPELSLTLLRDKRYGDTSIKVFIREEGDG